MGMFQNNGHFFAQKKEIMKRNLFPKETKRCRRRSPCAERRDTAKEARNASRAFRRAEREEEVSEDEERRK